ncbi:hypothetical protein CPLU01_15989 [Colletotrichum plurivorum]|uniref:Uncharacterized protein n=1 Tax=Colletotrichum plurivorum TaxID=2175906 RepID=A0A8H6J3G6_9PEZI|nr:hypothetical protein CPLU01_15989 [Colletotrichum plurivorum]
MGVVNDDTGRERLRMSKLLDDGLEPPYPSAPGPPAQAITYHDLDTGTASRNSSTSVITCTPEALEVSSPPSPAQLGALLQTLIGDSLVDRVVFDECHNLVESLLKHCRRSFHHILHMLARFPRRVVITVTLPPSFVLTLPVADSFNRVPRRSAIQFGDLKWKLQALRAAEELALLTLDYVNLARITFRHWTLKRLHPAPCVANRGPPFSLPPIDCIAATHQRANAFLGQRALIEAQNLIDTSASPTDVRQAISSFRAYKPEKISFQEQLTLLEGHFLYAKSLRYSGQFDAASKSLWEVLTQAERLKSRLTLKIVLHFAEAECERGNHASALRELEDDKMCNGSLQQLELGSGRRVSLALANVRLLHAVEILDKTQRLDHQVVLEAEKLFTWLRDTRLPGPESDPICISWQASSTNTAVSPSGGDIPWRE